MTIHAFAAFAPKALLEPFAYEPDQLRPSDVAIEISHCGVCYSDVHLIDDDWKKSVYPFVPGHEIVGVVTARGGSVTHLKVGQRVGVGWQNGACLACEYCISGQENLCLTQTATCVRHHGGFAGAVVTDSRFAFALPEGLDSAIAAPLMCGGVTVYSPMRRYGVNGLSSVGVVGIGGLGHMAIAIAKAMGAEITAFSSSSNKRDEAMRMGAHHFVASTDPREIRKRASSIDLLLSTVHSKMDWIAYMQTLRPNGVLCFVGASDTMFSVPQTAFLGQRAVTMSEIGSRRDIAELLAFAERHKIAPEIQIAPMDEVNTAVERLRQNQVRYRMVLENR